MRAVVAEVGALTAVRLTHRERTIAVLIGEGMTSAQIGTRLKIAERTVDSHAEHIRNKLGLHSRAQIAAWAVRELLVAHSPDYAPAGRTESGMGGRKSTPPKALATTLLASV